MPEGIDVSKWQGTVNWNEVAKTKVFAIARSSIGMQTTDETWAANYTGAVKAGLVPGAYHLVAGDSTGPQQAANFKRQLDAVGFNKGLLVLDVEGWSGTTNGLEAGTLKATEYLCDWIKTTYKRDPIIYTGVYWRENLKQHPDNFGAELWLAYYGADPTPYVPRAWTSWRLWQYTQTGSVAGISGNVDLNKSSGTIRSLKSLAGWEWDELATQAEIRNIVSEEVVREVAKAIAASAAGADRTIAAAMANREEILRITTTHRDSVLNAIRESEVRLANDIVSKHPEVMTREELTAKFTEIMDELQAPVEDTNVQDFADLAELVNTLHKHVCNRVDLHA